MIREKNPSYKLIVDEDFVNQRLDNFLFGKLDNVPKSHIYKMIRVGEIRVNQKRINPLYKINESDVVRVPPLWKEISTSNQNKNQNNKNSNLKLNLTKNNLKSLLLKSIIYEDKKILVINKPSGMAVHGGSGINIAIIDVLREARKDLKNLDLVHRLDRYASGCLILAKKKSYLRALHKLIREGKITKKYLMLVRGQWTQEKKIINSPLLSNQLKSGERIVQISKKGKKSTTIFRPIKVGQLSSLIEAELKTGRTHQIRVHAASIGYPIIGDDKYGDKDFNYKMKTNASKEIFLHASTISFCLDKEKKFTFNATIKSKLMNQIINLL